jgi:hypothetical protein
MRNLPDEWAQALVEDLRADLPVWAPENLAFHPSTTTEEMARPCLLITGEEEARTHPRQAIGEIRLALHWHRNDGTPAAAREILRLAALEADTRRDSIKLDGVTMTYYLPRPEMEEVREDGFVFVAVRAVRMREDTVNTP